MLSSLSIGLSACILFLLDNGTWSKNILVDTRWDIIEWGEKRCHNNRPWNCLKIKFSLIELLLHQCQIKLHLSHLIATLMMMARDPNWVLILFLLHRFFLISFDIIRSTFIPHHDYVHWRNFSNLMNLCCNNSESC